MWGVIRKIASALRAVGRYELSGPVNLAIVLVTSAVFAAQRWVGRNAPGVDSIWFELGYNREPILSAREPWRLLSPNLIHTASWWSPTGRLAWIGTIGLLHLLSVVLALLLFGPLVERTFGHRRYAVIYVVSATASYALLLIRDPGPFLQGGATGAVYGVFAAFLVLVLLHRREPYYARLARPAIVMFVILAAAQYGWTEPVPQLIHVGGFGAGLILGLLLDPRVEQRAPEAPTTYEPISYKSL